MLYRFVGNCLLLAGVGWLGFLGACGTYSLDDNTRLFFVFFRVLGWVSVLAWGGSLGGGMERFSYHTGSICW